MSRMASRDDDNLAPAHFYAQEQPHGLRVPAVLALLLTLVALLAGLGLGSSLDLSKTPLAFLSQGSKVSFGTLGGKTAIRDSDLDSVVATYVYEGEVHEITAREAIEQEGSLQAMSAGDGSYVMPSAESVLSAARTAVLMRDVEAHGITVSDDDVRAYAEKTFGTSDMASLSTAYNMDQETIQARMKESAAIAKLREQVVPGSDAAASSLAKPAEPTDGDADATSKEYADYIIGLAGDEWDSEANAWKQGDSTYAKALKEFDITNEAASYNAALAAYDVAYQNGGDSNSAAATKWTEYVNGLLCNASLALSSIVS